MFAICRSGAVRQATALLSIINYNNAPDTIAAVECFRQQAYTGLDIEVYDNASTDASVASIAQECTPINIVLGATNEGYAGAISGVFERAIAKEYEYVIICNSDIVVDCWAIERLIETAATYRDAGVVGGVEDRNDTGKLGASCGSGYFLWGSRAIWRHRSTPSTGGTVSRCDFVQGCIMLFTRVAIDKGVAPDKKLFMYGEEADIGFQLREKGLGAYVDHRVIVRHKCSRAFNLTTGYYCQRNRLYLVRKYGSRLQRWTYVAYCIALELPVKTGLRVIQRRGAYAEACLRGFVDGLLGNMGRRHTEPKQ